MSKEIGELEDLKNAFIGHCRELKCEENYIKVCNNKFNKIEKELKEYEELKSNYKQLGKSYDLICEELVKTIDKIACLRKKELKALEIIKEKRVNLSILLDLFAFKFNTKFDARTYNSMIKSRKIQLTTFPPYGLTQEEYELLKEVLL